MSDIGIVLSSANIIIGLFIIIASRSFLKNDVKKNHWLGPYLRRTQDNDDNWRKINHFAAEQLRVYSSLIVAAGLIGLFIDIGSSISLIVVYILLPIMMAVPIIRVWHLSAIIGQPSK